MYTLSNTVPRLLLYKAGIGKAGIFIFFSNKKFSFQSDLNKVLTFQLLLLVWEHQHEQACHNQHHLETVDIVKQKASIDTDITNSA